MPLKDHNATTWGDYYPESEREEWAQGYREELKLQELLLNPTTPDKEGGLDLGRGYFLALRVHEAKLKRYENLLFEIWLSRGASRGLYREVRTVQAMLKVVVFLLMVIVWEMIARWLR